VAEPEKVVERLNAPFTAEKSSQELSGRETVTEKRWFLATCQNNSHLKLMFSKCSLISGVSYWFLRFMPEFLFLAI
jgi:hypothetical protein